MPATRTTISSLSSCICGALQASLRRVWRPRERVRFHNRRSYSDHTSEGRRFPRRNTRRRLGAAHRLSATAPGASRPRQGGARGFGPRSGVAVRPQQHPICHEYAHRRVGTGQERPLRAAHAWRGPDPVGLRISCPPPSAVRAMAPSGELPCRRLAHARCDARRDRDPGPARREDRPRVARVRPLR